MGNRVTPAKGEMYEWPGMTYHVREVDPDLKWVDVWIYLPGVPVQARRVNLPLPQGFEKVS